MDTTVKWPIPSLTLVAYQAVLLESVNNESATCAIRGSDAFSSSRALKKNAWYTDNHSRIWVKERISYEFYMISKSWEELKFLSRYKILTSWKDTTQVSNFTWQ